MNLPMPPMELWGPLMRQNKNVMKIVFFIFICLIILNLLSSPIHACGACYEDNLAAVYSYEAVEKAREHPEKLEFVVLKIEGSLPQQKADLLTRWCFEKRGIDVSTVKVSTEQKSMGFLFEKKKLSPATLLGDLKKDFPDLSFKILPYERL